MAADVADVANFNGEIVTRLPLNVERIVERIRKFVSAVVVGEGEQWQASGNCRRIRNHQVRGIARRWCAKSRAPRRLKTAAIRIRIRTARLRIHPRGRLIHAERTARNHAGGETRREIRKEFAAIVVHAPARANHYFVVKFSRAPGQSNARRQPPLPAGQSRIAHALGGKQRIVSRDDKAVGSDGIGGCVIAVFRRIKIENTAVLFSKSSVIVEANAAAETEVGSNLKLVLHIPASLVRSEISVGIALQERGGDKAVCRVGNGRAGEKVVKVSKADHPRIRSIVSRVQLRIRKASTEGKRVLAQIPNGIGRRHPAVLKNSGEGALRCRRGTDIRASIENEVRVERRLVA